MNPLDKTTRGLVSFESVDEIMRWLYRHGCATDNTRKPIEQMWNARAYRLAHPERFFEQELNYKFFIRVRKNGTRFVTWKREFFYRIK